VPNVKKFGALTYPDPLGPSRRPVVGETFTFTLTMLSVYRNMASFNGMINELARIWKETFVD